MLSLHEYRSAATTPSAAVRLVGAGTNSYAFGSQFVGFAGSAFLVGHALQRKGLSVRRLSATLQLCLIDTALCQSCRSDLHVGQICGLGVKCASKPHCCVVAIAGRYYYGCVGLEYALVFVCMLLCFAHHSVHQSCADLQCELVFVLCCSVLHNSQCM